MCMQKLDCSEMRVVSLLFYLIVRRARQETLAPLTSRNMMALQKPPIKTQPAKHLSKHVEVLASLGDFANSLLVAVINATNSSRNATWALQPVRASTQTSDPLRTHIQNLQLVRPNHDPNNFRTTVTGRKFCGHIGFCQDEDSNLTFA